MLFITVFFSFLPNCDVCYGSGLNDKIPGEDPTGYASSSAAVAKLNSESLLRINVSETSLGDGKELYDNPFDTVMIPVKHPDVNPTFNQVTDYHLWLAGLPQDMKGHILMLDMHGVTVHEQSGLLIDPAFPAVLQTIAERGGYIVLTTAEQASFADRALIHQQLIACGIDLSALANICVTRGGMQGFPSFCCADEDSYAVRPGPQFDSHMLFTDGKVGLKGYYVIKLMMLVGLDFSKVMKVHCLDDSGDALRGVGDAMVQFNIPHDLWHVQRQKPICATKSLL